MVVALILLTGLTINDGIEVLQLYASADSSAAPVDPRDTLSATATRRPLWETFSLGLSDSINDGILTTRVADPIRLLLQKNRDRANPFGRDAYIFCYSHRHNQVNR
jgi:hypothetical protein